MIPESLPFFSPCVLLPPPEQAKWIHCNANFFLPLLMWPGPAVATIGRPV